ncbi:hypothetical protein [Aeoliella mucimassa]|uniref:Uncharacterized protein n=1 Tax=Aeoliella mucimassa TaxID=2527972 RepID=A0A518ASB9_9BACT|nr:hypothetical protein [Aeoliella mucimassa]QDU57612.1 hypothetical protein Pan181_38300 [Aeoliella mucimassa]
MSNTTWLWEQLHDQFDTDDGSLPDVYFENLNPDAIIGAYELLISRAKSTVTECPVFWSKTDEQEHPLNSVPNAAALVVCDEAEPFHVVLGGIEARGTVIPDLGVFVFQECIALDYRMGAEWGPLQLDAFFGLLLELSALDQTCRLTLDEHVQQGFQDRFHTAFLRFKRENAPPEH